MALSAVRDFYDLIRNLAKILVVGVIALLQLLPSIPQKHSLRIEKLEGAWTTELQTDKLRLVSCAIALT